MNAFTYLTYLVLGTLFPLLAILILLNISYLYFLIRSYNNHNRNKNKQLSVSAWPQNEAGWPYVSVIVPSYNESESINRVLTSLKNVDYPKDKLEIIFIDDSSDDTSSIIRKYMCELSNTILIKNKRRFGKAYALNLGAQIARGEILVVFDADNYFPPDTLKKLIYPFLEDTRVWATQGSFYVNPKSKMNQVINVEYLMWQVPQALEFPLIYGYNYAVRKDILNVLGKWRTDGLSEDTDLAIRIHLNGGKIKYVEDAKVQVLEPDLSKELILQRKRWLKGTLDVLKKYSPDSLFLLPPAKKLSRRIRNAMSLYSRGTVPSILTISLFGSIFTYPFALLSSNIWWLFYLFMANTVLSLVNILGTLVKSKQMKLAKSLIWLPFLGLLNVLALFKSIFDRKIVWKRTDKLLYPEVNLELLLSESETNPPSPLLAFDSVLLHRISFR